MGDRYIIKEGDTVVFDNGNTQAIITVRSKSKVKLGKTYCPVDPLIGCPFGSLFTLSTDGKSLQRVQHVPSTEWDEPAEVTQDNSQLVDANEAHQKLKQQDLAAMREAGAAGEEIIEALTSGSTTFHTKTEFAQEKYKKRKAKKYVILAVARRPTAATIAAAYGSKRPSKVGFLRQDSLALMLSMANVGAHARVLVMEACGGLVTGAVAERLGGYGVACSTYAGAKPPPSMEIAKNFNFDEHTAAAMRTVPLLRLLELRTRQRETHGPPYTGLIFACPDLDPTPAVCRLFPLLAPSASFAVYSPCLQPLAECMAALRGRGLAVNMLVQEAWCRDYQVLPMRTHPLMQMSHGGGYMLSGTATLHGTSLPTGLE